ncbi:unnamed protein product, partial [Rotaria magnacalcarata]
MVPPSSSLFLQQQLPFNKQFNSNGQK